jgi:hypothetical protein
MSTERPLVIFIDGLDECSEPYELLKYLGVIIRNSSGLIKLCCTHCPNIEVRNLIPLSTPCQQVDLRKLADLASPTPNLSEVHHQAMDRIVELPSAQKSPSICVLKWILCYFRPPASIKLANAVSIKFGQDYRSPLSLNLIIELYNGLVTQSSDAEVSLCHSSLRDFLETFELDGNLLFSSQECHAQASTSCLLCLLQTNTGTDQAILNTSLGSYATIY